MLEIDDIFAYLDREVKYIEETESSIEYIHRISITKHSFNIIDLIECGDIVETFDVLHNEIVYIWNEEMLKALKEDIENGIQIKSIVTHESFNSIKYEVK